MNNKSDIWLMQNGKYLPRDASFNLQDKIEKLPEDKAKRLFMCDLINPVTMLLFCIFLNSLSIDRFMIGQIGKGILRIVMWILFGISYVLTFVFLDSGSDGFIITIGFMIVAMIYSIIEMATCLSRTREYNLKLVMKTIK